VISIRYSEDILGVWNKTADREVIGLLRDAIKKVLQLPPQASMEYKPHQTSILDKSSFRNTQVRCAVAHVQVPVSSVVTFGPICTLSFSTTHLKIPGVETEVYRR